MNLVTGFPIFPLSTSTQTIKIPLLSAKDMKESAQNKMYPCVIDVSRNLFL